MLPEERARVKIDKQLSDAGWDIVARDEYVPFNASAVKEALMQGNKESDYLLFIDDKAIAVVEAKAEDNALGDVVAQQAEWYSQNPQGWVGLWFPCQIPFVYLANGNNIYFKNMLEPDSEYVELSEMHSPKKMLQLLGKKSEYGALPQIEKKGLRDCQYNAEVNLEASLKAGKKKALAILATGSGKTYLACLAAYRLLNYTPTRRVLFLVDRNNLARQTETEFSLFDRTEKQKPMNELYQINRLKKPEDIQGDIIISTIQKLFAVLTGQTIIDDDEDKEDERIGLIDTVKNEPAVVLDGDLKLPPDYFQFIIVDECHRSIYGKWKAVLDYFKDAKMLGLTATPIPEAQAYFNNNEIAKYTYDDSVVDGVNVPARVYRIITEATVHGGTIAEGETVTDVNRAGEVIDTYTAQNRIDYAPNQLDRSVINPNQIEAVLKSYMDAIYTDLYPEREEKWQYIPKTLIFAKDDNHATKIVEAAKKVFAVKFANGEVPENFVQKITYSAGDSNALIRDLRTEKDFRIAVTVTLVATGTDVKPLEVVLFMNDVKSDVLYTQMKGRGCRTLDEDKLREVTPNADNKSCFYIVDAVGVTESDKTIPQPGKGSEGGNPKPLRLDQLLEQRIIAAVNNLLFEVDSIDADSKAIFALIAQTKAKILDLAIRGQLVPQDPNDEPASVLLERIRAEKEGLIKQGKIKRDKKESFIFRGEDNSYYLNDGQMTVDISDDLPFDVPDSWRWVRLKDVFIINPRNMLDDDLDVSFIPMLLIDDGYSGKHTSEVRQWKEVKTGFTHFTEGDVGIAKITPCFENRKSTVFENLSNGYGAGTTELHVLRPFGKNILAQYLLAYVKTDYFVENGMQTFTGDVGQQRISKAYVENAYFPLPPIKEQERIVQQIGIIFEHLNMITDALS